MLKMKRCFPFTGWLLLGCGYVALAQPAHQGKPRELREYHEQLRQLSVKQPAGEYVSVNIDGSFVFRNLNIWTRAQPAVQGTGGLSRRLTVFLDDTLGNRVRTLPNRVALSVAPPARLVLNGEQRLENGEVTNELIYGPEQRSARLTITLLPSGAGMGAVVDLPAVTEKPVRFLGLTGSDELGHRVKTSSGSARETARVLLQDARRFAQGGKRRAAQRLAFSHAEALLEADLVEEALEAFRLGARDFDSILCAWGEIQLLRALGQNQQASGKTEALRLKEPQSVPAAFLDERASELWLVPLGDAWARLRERRTR